MKNSIKKTDILIVGAGFAGLYLAYILLSEKRDKLLIVAPDKKTVSDKSYYNFRSSGRKQASLKVSMLKAGLGRCNSQLVDVFVNNIDNELSRLNRIIEMQPSYLGAKIVNPKALLKKLREKTESHRLHNEVVKIKKRKDDIIAETKNEIICCKKLIFCNGGNRFRFSGRFSDEKTSYDILKIARDAGCKTESLDKIMYHPFYSKGICIPSDDLSDFDIVDQNGKKLTDICYLLKAHNAHHCLDKICKEFNKTKQRFAVKGDKRIELEIEPHYTLGGIKINKHGQTNIKNIYALGECSFGMHGHGRIGGCALSEIIVMARVIANKI